MKTNLKLSKLFKSLAIVIALTFSWSAQAAKKSDEKSFCSNLSLTITHGESINLDNDVLISFSISESVNLKSVFLKNKSKQVAIENNGRIKTRGDGKIDVDIIIKMSLFNEMFQIKENLLPNRPHGYKQILDGLDLILITVDNISGVFASAPTSPGNVRIAIIDETVNNVDNDMIEISASTMKQSSETEKVVSTQSSEFTVFPTPSFNNEVNIRIPDDVKVNSIQIFNSLGVLINSEINNSNAQLLEVKMNTLQKGIYFSRLQTNKGEFIQKIILR